MDAICIINQEHPWKVCDINKQRQELIETIWKVEQQCEEEDSEPRSEKMRRTTWVNLRLFLYTIEYFYYSIITRKCVDALTNYFSRTQHSQRNGGTAGEGVGDEHRNATAPYELMHSTSDAAEDAFQLNTLNRRPCNRLQMSANTIEAKVEPGDTLQALALRFGCTAAEIKRLNKIDKDNEIHAHKVLKIPMTIHNVLLDHLPSIHHSGNNSPRNECNGGWRTEHHDSREGHSRDSSSGSGLSSLIHNPLESAEAVLSEKLLVASVNSSQLRASTDKSGSGHESPTINDIIMQANNKHSNVYEDGKCTLYSYDQFPTNYDLMNCALFFELN